MALTKEEFFEKMKAQFDDVNYRWNLERNRLEALAQKATAEARNAFETEREDFRKFRKEMQEQLVDLDVAGENAWYDLKEGVESAWKSLNQAFKKAASHFK